MDEKAYLNLIVNMIKDDFEHNNKNEVTISKGEFKFLSQHLIQNATALQDLKSLNDENQPAVTSKKKQDFVCCECKEPTKIIHPKQHMMSRELVMQTRCIDCLINILNQDMYDYSQQAAAALNFIKEKGYSEEYEYFRLEWE